jgi:hypothetical protein
MSLSVNASRGTVRGEKGNVREESKRTSALGGVSLVLILYGLYRDIRSGRKTGAIDCCGGFERNVGALRDIPT